MPILGPHKIMKKKNSKKPTTPSLSKPQKQDGELVFGIHAIVELLKAGKRKLLSIYTTKPTPKGFEQIEALLTKKYPINLQYVERDVLHRIAQSTDHQGVVAWAKPFGFRRKPFDPQTHKVLVLIDGVQDPRNVGAIIRSAYCTKTDGVIMCQKGSAPLSAIALKAAAGLAEHMDIYQAPSAQVAADELIAAGYKLYLTTFDGESAANCSYQTPMCLVIGGEALGITKSLLSRGVHVTLPQKTADISYNASVAAGIFLFLINTQLKRLD